MAIWQDLADEHAVPSGHAGVERLIAELREQAPRDAQPVTETAPCDEDQAGHRDGPMVRHLSSGNDRRVKVSARAWRRTISGEHSVRCR